MRTTYETAESVAMGHPDKIADQISDAILDAHLKQDRNSRVACETVIKGDSVGVLGEITSKAEVEIDRVVKDTIRRIGYADRASGFDLKKCSIHLNVNQQSPDIDRGVSSENQGGLGAGDQGIIIGYACRESAAFDENALMPLPIFLAHRLIKRLDDVRRERILPWLRPDGKCQVTVEYHDAKPIRLSHVVLSAQHDESVCMNGVNGDLSKDAKHRIEQEVIREGLPRGMMDDNTIIYVNPTGRFVIGGPQADTGLTGRKIIVDTYGPRCAHGGGAFSGKDPTKVDRSAAYMARYVAKNIVAAKWAMECEVRLAYIIGGRKSIHVSVDAKGPDSMANGEIEEHIKNTFDLSPDGIIARFGLFRPIYLETACYGHFGRSGTSFPWEEINEADWLK